LTPKGKTSVRTGVEKKKNLVNFSCTSRHRDSGMLQSFERRFDFFEFFEVVSFPGIRVDVFLFLNRCRSRRGGTFLTEKARKSSLV